MESPSSPPKSESFDPGSSVSTNMMEEYEDLLRYAVVTPNINGGDSTARSTVSPNFKASISVRNGTMSTRPPTRNPVATKTVKLSEVISSDDEEQPTRQTNSTQSASTGMESSMNIRGSSIRKDETKLSEPLIPSHQPTGGPSAAVHVSHALPLSTQHTSVREEDTELARLDSQLDLWCSELKSNVLAEFVQTKLRTKEKFNKEMQQERDQHVKAIHNLTQDIQRKMDLIKAYESSLAKKDEVIVSLTKSLQKQKQQVTLAKTMSMWKYCHMDKKREGFTEKLALKHRNHVIKSRILRAWFGLIQGRWKQRVEKACQLRAEEVCHEVTNEYEGKLAALHHSYEEALGEISVLRGAQSVYEENMKKAFMRGVCALNMEAMTMFSDPKASATPRIPPPAPPPSNPPPLPRHSNSDTDCSGKYRYDKPGVTASNNVPGTCRHVNVEFHRSDTRKPSRKIHPTVSVERHIHK